MLVKIPLLLKENVKNPSSWKLLLHVTIKTQLKILYKF